MRRPFVFGIPFFALLLATTIPACVKFRSTNAQASHGGHSDPKSFFCDSLHATGEGMRYWYEEEGGFRRVTGIPYRDLGCKGCHVRSCDQCHAVEKDGSLAFSLEKSRDNKTCLGCHARTKKAMALDAAAGVKDVHFAAGMSCSDCHSGTDVHGDGKHYKSMRSPAAVKVSCSAADCHDDLDMALKPHKQHAKNIDCAACHVSSTITCLNCHFDRFLAEKKRKGNFFAAKKWTLLVNHEGKVTTGNAQTLIGKGRKFVAYVPYFTHSVVKKGRSCGDCHGVSAAVKMANGKPVEMATFAAGKLTHIEGVVPFVPELIKWPWLDKSADGTWSELKSDEKPIVQNAAFAEPLSKAQLQALAQQKK